MRLERGFYEQDLLDLARSLLGKVMVRQLNGQELRARIVEVEAYHQDGDAAAHSFSGPTPRNAVMFGLPGYLYVYFIYGMHHCMNVVCCSEGIGAAILIRALEPLRGIEQMRIRRGARIRDRDLTNGPAKACAAFALDRDQNGLDLCTDRSLFLVDAPRVGVSEIVSGPRIGISKATALPWRFYIRGNPFVSKPHQ